MYKWGYMLCKQLFKDSTCRKRSLAPRSGFRPSRDCHGSAGSSEGKALTSLKKNSAYTHSATRLSVFLNPIILKNPEIL